VHLVLPTRLLELLLVFQEIKPFPYLRLAALGKITKIEI